MTIAVLGAGPHGRQIAELFPSAQLFDDRLPGFRSTRDGASLYPYVIGAAWPKVRREIGDQLHAAKLPHQMGQVVFPGARLGNDIWLGLHVHIGFNAVVSHGCIIGDYVTVSPGAVLCGEVQVEEGAFIGANAVVKHGGITIGARAVVGCGAVVVDDVKPGAVVVGVPAKDRV